MNRKMVIAGLKAYKGIEHEISRKMLFAQETDDANYEREAEALRKIKQDIIRCLNDLPQLERDCLWEHYVKNELWVRICRKYAYSERQIRNISNRGLDRLGRAISERPDLMQFCKARADDDTY